MRLCLLAILLVACGEDPSPSPSLEPEPGEPSTPTETHDETSATRSADPALAEDREAPDLDVEDEDDEGRVDPAYRINSELSADDGIEHPNPQVRRVLIGLHQTLSRRASALAIARATGDYDQEEGGNNFDMDARAGGGCSVALLHEHFVTFTCTDTYRSRMDISRQSESFHYSVLDGEVRPVDPFDLVEPREALSTRMRARCEVVMQEEADEGRAMPRDTCESLDISIAATGLLAEPTSEGLDTVTDERS
jgi:hypothetical protein